MFSNIFFVYSSFLAVSYISFTLFFSLHMYTAVFYVLLRSQVHVIPTTYRYHYHSDVDMVIQRGRFKSHYHFTHNAHTTTHIPDKQYTYTGAYVSRLYVCLSMGTWTNTSCIYSTVTIKRYRDDTSPYVTSPNVSSPYDTSPYVITRCFNVPVRFIHEKKCGDHIQG